MEVPAVTGARRQELTEREGKCTAKNAKAGGACEINNKKKRTI